jgi:hypothetical protein
MQLTHCWTQISVGMTRRISLTDVYYYFISLLVLSMDEILAMACAASIRIVSF